MIVTKPIPIAEIVTDSGTQIRSAINEDTVENYAADMAAGQKFPNIVVFHDGNLFILADGFHRLFAAKRNGEEKIRAEIWKGTRADALKYALSANASHGLRRTNADKRRSVELALAEWPNLSDRELAKVCAVGDHLVADARKINCVNPAVESTPRIGADGKTRKLPEKKPKAEPIPSPAPQDEPFDAPEPEPPVTEYYDRLKFFVELALENATKKQLISMSVYAKQIPGLIKEKLKK